MQKCLKYSRESILYGSYEKGLKTDTDERGIHKYKGHQPKTWNNCDVVFPNITFSFNLIVQHCSRSMHDTCVHNLLLQCKVDRVPMRPAYETLHAIVFISLPNYAIQMYTVKTICKTQNIKSLEAEIFCYALSKKNLLQPGY